VQLLGAYQAEFKVKLWTSFRYTYVHIFASENALKLTNGNPDLKAFFRRGPRTQPDEFVPYIIQKQTVDRECW
jgi:hypothetical protein